MAIHWWNTGHLVDELARGQVSEEQSFTYAVLSTLLINVSLYYAYWVGGQRSWLLVFEFVAICVIALIGLYECFKANGGPKGIGFLHRFICLGVPVGIKIFLVGLLASLLLTYGVPRIATSASFRDPYFVYEVATFAFMCAFTGIYYWRIAYHMGRVANPERSNHSMQPTGGEPPAAD